MTEPKQAQQIERAALYEAIATRRNTSDNLRWQVPALGLTGQAFLLQIVVNGEIEDPFRVGAAALALLVALMSAHLLVAHTAYIGLDEWMLRLLDESVIAGGPLKDVVGPHDSGWERFDAFARSKGKRWEVKVTRRLPAAQHLWLVTLGLFVAADILAMVWIGIGDGAAVVAAVVLGLVGAAIGVVVLSKVSERRARWRQSD